MTDNIKSLRVHTNEVLYCFQCLYQNAQITTEQKNELVRTFKNCLSNEESNEAKRIFNVKLQDIFYRSDLPMFLKQQVEQVMNLM